tara:strand:+ start:141 stop:911 length:771 start_codon:yes stop_codon:yes gene_type:complete
MKAIILAGGLGTRLSEETSTKPKPMVEIGGMPIIWHIMNIYSFYGINDFIICCGYKGSLLKDFFTKYLYLNSDITVDMSKNDIELHSKNKNPWKISLIDTGGDTMTGGRLLKIKDYLHDCDDVCFTYGDGVGNVNIQESIDFHKQHQKLVTMTVAYPPPRFGSISLEGQKVIKFSEKPDGEGGLINAGFFVLKKEALNYIQDDQTTWEEGPLNNLTADGELMAYVHKGFWKPMDTLNDRNHLEKLWNNGEAEWKVW